MSTFYNFGIQAYRLGIGMVSPFNKKAKLWIEGRKNWLQKLQAVDHSQHQWIWFHCSSLGEFEQGRPLIEAIKAAYPHYKLLLTFFSPSGYEIRKNYAVADQVVYLPLDTKANAAAFLDEVKPCLAFFVKYDLWLNFIAACEVRQIPLILVSALVRPDSKFLNSILRHQYKKAFQSFAWIFTQDETSQQLLSDFSGSSSISVAGDTRFDRVAQLVPAFQPIPEVEAFVAGRKCIVAGSPWPKDEEILLPTIAQLRSEQLCWIIAPHEIHPEAIDRHVSASNGKMVKFSQLPSKAEADILWIDNIGMLSRLYKYAEFVYIGGGFGAGIHNTQEAAIYGNPVSFGPKYDKFQEAVDMVKEGGAVAVKNQAELKTLFKKWLSNPDLVIKMRRQNRDYMLSRTGACKVVMEKLKSSNWLS